MKQINKRRLDEVADDVLETLLLFRRVSGVAPHGRCRRFDPSRFVLKKVLELGPIRMSELGKHMEISKPYMTALVNRLIAEGLVERVREPGDRRVVNIRITPSGKGVLREFRKTARQNIMTKLSSLSSKDIRSLHESVKEVKRIISKLD